MSGRNPSSEKINVSARGRAICGRGRCQLPLSRAVFLLLCLWLLATGATAQTTKILYVLDASFSMKKNWDGATKWETAINTIAQISDSICKIPNVVTGLRAFGDLYDESEHNCKDTRLEIPIGKNNAERFLSKLKTLKPKGITPIAYALEKAAGDFGADESRNILILITDGEEACEGDVCAASLLLQQRGIILKPFVIGLQLNVRAEATFQCVGDLVNVNSGAEFTEQLDRIVNEAIAKTTVQVDLNNEWGKPLETAVPLTFSDAKTGVVKYRFFHTLNAYGMPDTITISPLFTYQLTIHTTPPIVIPQIALKKNEHNRIAADAARGTLQPKFSGVLPKNFLPEDIPVLIHLPDSGTILLQSTMNRAEPLLTGKYDVSLLTLPRTAFSALAVPPGKTTEIVVPVPGMVQLQCTQEVEGALLYYGPRGLEALERLRADKKLQQWWLQPGKYKVVYRARSAKTIHSSVEKDFEVTSGGSVSLKL